MKNTDELSHLVSEIIEVAAHYSDYNNLAGRDEVFWEEFFKYIKPDLEIEAKQLSSLVQYKEVRVKYKGKDVFDAYYEWDTEPTDEEGNTCEPHLKVRWYKEGEWEREIRRLRKQIPGVDLENIMSDQLVFAFDD